jgi:hypothetical protein
MDTPEPAPTVGESSDAVAIMPVIEKPTPADADAFLQEHQHRITKGNERKLMRALFLVDPAAARSEVAKLPDATPERDADKFLARYARKNLTPAQKELLRQLYIADPDQADDEAFQLEDLAPPPDKLIPPPKPMHDPFGAPTKEEKAEAQKRLIAEIRKEGKFPRWEEAYNEARRRAPHLF